jgi:hypothetical protein
MYRTATSLRTAILRPAMASAATGRGCRDGSPDRLLPHERAREDRVQGLAGDELLSRLVVRGGSIGVSAHSSGVTLC